MKQLRDENARLKRVVADLTPDKVRLQDLENAAQAWEDITRNLPGVMGISPSGLAAAGRASHGKIVLRVA